MRLSKIAFATAGAAALSLSMAMPAVALPPGGANTVDSAGTSATVGKTAIAYDGKNCVLPYELKGFPAGTTASVKVDDGKVAGANPSVQYDSVWAQSKVDANGVAKGSIDLCEKTKLPVGKHYLRFLTTEYDANGEVKARYSTRGKTDFEVVTKIETPDPGKTNPGKTNPGDSKDGSTGGGGGIAIVIAIVVALLGAIGAAVSGAIPGLPRP
ncbi:hypothetical protein [Corynebacterium aquilae]|uniref:Uncharacterized protein n=1 Tax=Corynebacterium aquilae DSM 44791 TaxID=1431546 RepID=A0A1L7CHF7_9CORY|nr:hypothetical protein [Corynebacterium aquilae]APT85301.1 hypothetical protein CAQU_09725 [Corynebacterium aquilae DSM 44791]